MSELRCVVCALPLEETEIRIGMGDGTGQRFGHAVCYWRNRAEILSAAVTWARQEFLHLFPKDEGEAASGRMGDALSGLWDYQGHDSPRDFPLEQKPGSVSEARRCVPQDL